MEKKPLKQLHLKMLKMIATSNNFTNWKKKKTYKKYLTKLEVPLTKINHLAYLTEKVKTDREKINKSETNHHHDRQESLVLKEKKSAWPDTVMDEDFCICKIDLCLIVSDNTQVTSIYVKVSISSVHNDLTNSATVYIPPLSKVH